MAPTKHRKLRRQNALRVRRSGESQVPIEMSQLAAQNVKANTPRRLNSSKFIQRIFAVLTLQCLIWLVFQFAFDSGFIPYTTEFNDSWATTITIGIFFVAGHLFIRTPRLHQGPWWQAATLFVHTFNGVNMLSYSNYFGFSFSDYSPYFIYFAPHFVTLISVFITALIVLIISCIPTCFNFRNKCCKVAIVILGTVISILVLTVLHFVTFNLKSPFPIGVLVYEAFYGVLFTFAVLLYIAIDIEYIIIEGRFGRQLYEEDYLLATLALNLDVIQLVTYIKSMII